ncbi:hypothetical protein DL95DRAFT_472029 [Leptodontidium sp. 2 PMI_412]|nr:hypothetical protein DL95DRAFT_472029 [Leptodontidium sp. 2 PMI_412]
MANLSMFAIPAYWLLCMLPHNYTITIMRKANNGRWDNIIPDRRIGMPPLRKSTLAEVCGRYECAEAAARTVSRPSPSLPGNSGWNLHPRRDLEMP